jgi:hypothetical protein
MSFDKLLAPVGHSSTPDTSELHLSFVSEKMEWDTEAHWPRKVQEVIQDYRERDDKGLANFRAIDTGEDVNAVGAECGQERHIDVVEWTSKRMK